MESINTYLLEKLHLGKNSGVHHNTYIVDMKDNDTVYLLYVSKKSKSTTQLPGKIYKGTCYINSEEFIWQGQYFRALEFRFCYNVHYDDTSVIACMITSMAYIFASCDKDLLEKLATDEHIEEIKTQMYKDDEHELKKYIDNLNLA